MKPFAYARPASVAEASRLLTRGSAAVAGGTDLLGLMKDGIAAPARLVDLTGLDLGGWSRERGSGLRIGALARLAALEEDERLARALPMVREALASAATLQLRNMGTVGGNLLQRNRCWYFRDEAFPCWLKGGKRCFAAHGENAEHAVVGAEECVMVSPSDLAPALIAHDAQVSLAGPRGKRRIPLADLFVRPSGASRSEHAIRPGEVLTEVRVPEAGLRRRGTYEKAMDRKTWTFALASAAVAAQVRGGALRDVRIVLGGVAAVPWRAAEAEAVAASGAMSEGLAERAAAAVLTDAQPLRDNAYKVPLARELVRRALLRLAAG